MTLSDLAQSRKISTEIPLSEVKECFTTFKVEHWKPEHFSLTSKAYRKNTALRMK